MEENLESCRYNHWKFTTKETKHNPNQITHGIIESATTNGEMKSFHRTTCSKLNKRDSFIGIRRNWGGDREREIYR